MDHRKRPARSVGDQEATMAETIENTRAGTVRVLDDAAIEAFASALRGPLLRPGEEGYDNYAHDLERDDRQAAGAHRPMYGRRRRDCFGCLRA